MHTKEKLCMATFRKLPSGKWNTQVRIKGYSALNKTFLTKEEAQEWASYVEATLKKKKRPKNTIESLMFIYLDEVLTINGKQRGGYDSIRNRLVNLYKYFKPLTLEQIASTDVATYKVERLKTAATGTVRLELQTLSRFLRWAAAEKGIECSDVVKPIKLPPEGKPRSKILGYVGVKCCKSNRYRTFLFKIK